MKKITCVLATLIGMLYALPNANCQITLTQADMPVVKDIIVVDSDLAPTVTPGSKGPSQAWNFLALKNDSALINNYVSVASTPYASYFPMANMADTVVGVHGGHIQGYTYFASNSGAFSIAGVTQADGYPAIGAFNPLFTQLVFPANYLNTFNGTAFAKTLPEAISFMTYDSAKANLTIYYKDTIDAWGSMTTPAGIYNVLRVKHYEYDVDSIFLQDNSILHTWSYSSLVSPAPFKVCTYVWYANAVHTPIAAMRMDTTYTTVKAVGWFSGITSTQSINELTADSKTLVYPNPCSTEITFKFGSPEAKYVSVFDITGRLVIETGMNTGSVSLNTSAYAAGIYIFQVKDITGNILDRGKFSVQ